MPSTGWGMTETNAIGTIISGQEYLDRPESSGRGSAVLALRVVDAEGRELPSGERAVDLALGLIARGWGHYEDFAENMAARQPAEAVSAIRARVHALGEVL